MDGSKSVNGYSAWEGCATERCFFFGFSGYLPLVGRWQ